ncbi:hypothetical protein AJ80_02888 [Polytolypa hystricis UAMH7299]|uniref:Uncharacterized protein n=1 Tax=Polytolypa hystricis (strain UAMH7299) TaxID=1447883 RepID=A0A2B7YPR0_POLH7|nr:hypothetical protein AJ80_02888 [Polytolypa hystricis UAMH7299]
MEQPQLNAATSHPQGSTCFEQDPMNILITAASLEPLHETTPNFEAQTNIPTEPFPENPYNSTIYARAAATNNPTDSYLENLFLSNLSSSAA